jgi:hypothetical protein
MLAEMKILVSMVRNDNQPETLKQNLDRMERIVDMLETSVEEREG